MNTTLSSPIRVPLPSSTMVGSGRHSRQTCLYGWVTWMMRSTPGSASRRPLSTFPSFPMRPMAVRCLPGMGRAS